MNFNTKLFINHSKKDKEKAKGEEEMDNAWR